MQLASATKAKPLHSFIYYCWCRQDICFYVSCIILICDTLVFSPALLFWCFYEGTSTHTHTHTNADVVYVDSKRKAQNIKNFVL